MSSHSFLLPSFLVENVKAPVHLFIYFKHLLIFIKYYFRKIHCCTASLSFKIQLHKLNRLFSKVAFSKHLPLEMVHPTPEN